MTTHTNIISVEMGCQITLDGISPLSPKISNQTEFAQAICQISVTNGQNITKAAVQVMDHRTSVVDNAPMSQLKHSNQKPEIPIDKTKLKVQTKTHAISSIGGFPTPLENDYPCRKIKKRHPETYTFAELKPSQRSLGNLKISLSSKIHFVVKKL